MACHPWYGCYIIISFIRISFIICMKMAIFYYILNMQASGCELHACARHHAQIIWHLNSFCR